jgi:alpha-glucuronidase
MKDLVKVELADNIEEVRKEYETTAKNDKQFDDYFMHEKGKKMELAIEVTDPVLFQSVYKMFFGTMQDAEKLGFKVNEIIVFPEQRVNAEAQKRVKELIRIIDEKAKKWEGETYK